jgi:hypothetical protein
MNTGFVYRCDLECDVTSEFCCGRGFVAERKQVSRATLRTPPARGQYPKEALTMKKTTYSPNERKACRPPRAMTTKATRSVSMSS